MLTVPHTVTKATVRRGAGDEERRVRKQDEEKRAGVVVQCRKVRLSVLERAVAWLAIPWRRGFSAAQAPVGI